MSKTTRVCEMAYLDPAVFEKLKALAASSGKPRSVLIREAVSYLFEHYAWLAKPNRHMRHAPPYTRRAAREARRPIDPVKSAAAAVERIEAFDRLPRRPESEATKARRAARLARLKFTR